MAFGQQKINRHAAGRAFDPNARVPTPGSADPCLIIATVQQQAQHHIIAAGVIIEQGPIQRTGATGAVLSVSAATRMAV